MLVCQPQSLANLMSVKHDFFTINTVFAFSASINMELIIVGAKLGITNKIVTSKMTVN